MRALLVVLLAAMAGCAAPIVRDVGYWPVQNKDQSCATGAALVNGAGCVKINESTNPVSCAIYTDDAGVSSDGHGALLRACFLSGKK